MTHLMVLFGAGASYDSVNEKRARGPSQEIPDRQPPLADHLFSDRVPYRPFVDAWPDARALISKLRIATGETVEDALARYEDQASLFPATARQLAAIRYYLRDLIRDSTSQWWSKASGITNYLSLVELLEQWRLSDLRNRSVSYATFNYDLLLEWALRDVTRHKFDVVPDWISELPVYKLHGSTNWGRVVANPEALGWKENSGDGALEGVQHNLIALAGSARLGPFEVAPDHALLSRTRQLLSPAIAVPARNKVFSMPDEHLDQLRHDLERINRLLVIGWAGGDRHLLDLLAEYQRVRRPTLIVAGGIANAKSVEDAFSAVGLGGSVRLSEHSFSSLLDGTQDDLRSFINETA